MVVEEDEQFVDAAQKLLNQLYGNSWQTPDVIRTLKRTSGSPDNTLKKSSINKKSPSPRKPKEKLQNGNIDKDMSSLKVTDVSSLCDFSMFRKDIVKTNLDSTRLVTPKTKATKISNNNCHTEPRNTNRTKSTMKSRPEQIFKAPQTEMKKPPPRTPAMAKLTANQIRSQNERWRQLIDDTDSESEGNNASDDDDADKSDDESWKATESEDDSDFEPSPVKPKNKSKCTTTNKRDNKKTTTMTTTKKNSRKPHNSSKDERSDDGGEKSQNSFVDDDSDFEVPKRKDTRTRNAVGGNNKKSTTANKNTAKKYEIVSDGSDDADDVSNSDSDFDSKNQRNKNNKSKVLKTKKNTAKGQKDDLVYLDLSKEEVSILEDVPQSPPANHDATFASRLNDILKTCRHEDKPKLPSSAQSTKTKRKLFTPMFGHDLEGDDIALPEIVEKENKRILVNESESIILDNATCPFDAQGRPKKLDIYNKQLESVKVGKPIFQLTPSPKKTAPTTPLREKVNETPNSKTKSSTKTNVGRKGDPKKLEDLSGTPNYKYSFLKSLDVTVSKAFCHPDALIYRESYRTKKEDLANILYELYNKKLFGNRLDVPLTWNKKLSNTAGRCLNKKKLGVRSSVIELSEKVLTSADRLRCTLIHELCHAATWIFNGEGGHGRTWKEWAQRANATFPEIPKIGVCHQYDIEYKYTYKCTLCGAKSHAHSKSKKVENIRCSYCHGAIEIFLNKKDKEGNIIPTPVKEPTGFAKFVKDNYKKYKRDDTKHADVMKILSNEFAALKVNKNSN
ncbi:germ cell nuclear acidic protein [Musca vetustissima]|uniref:germ cell nuclear acidic protein n=1 Tax=Musca vetustissima TaxID=27455 RepID=UPI002AB6F2CA|nr:germ cell nuclear acidic protein [Musca vetustissima]